MIRIAVCDDEQKIVNLLGSMIREYLSDCEIEDFNSGNELLLNDTGCDIYFLDICMNDLDGMQTAKKIREDNEDAIIIFITGEREYVFDAFDVGAFHYLLKPIQKDKLIKVLNRAIKQINRKNAQKHQIFIPMKGRNITLNVNDIVYLENQRHKLIIYTIKDNIECYGVMTEMEKKLGNAFFRCHRGYLVNMAYIAEYSATSIILINGENLYFSRNRYQDFVKQYMRYLRNGGVSHAR